MEASDGNDKMPPATATATVTVTAAAESAGSYQPPVAVAAAVASPPPAAIVIPIPAGGAAPPPAAVVNPSLAGGAAPPPPVSSASPVALPAAAPPVPVGASPAVSTPAPLVTGAVGASPAGQVSFGHASLIVAVPGAAGVMKKRRGRPRKYAPDGSLLMPLNPTPISASVPAGEYPAVAAAMKRGRGRPAGYLSKHQPRIEFESIGEMVACSAGANFTPHVITVPAGEDVTTKIMSFSQQGPRAICILSANGSISNVTLRQPDSSGGTLTYEGRFELLSLSGSFMPSDNGATRSRSGGMSVSLASPDGRVVGGAVAGLLVAAGPVQVVVGSFLPSYQMEQKTKKPRLEPASASTPTSAIPSSSPEREETYGSGQGQRGSSTPKPNFSASSFRGENWSASIPSVPDTRTQNSAPDARNSKTDINMSLPGG